MNQYSDNGNKINGQITRYMDCAENAIQVSDLATDKKTALIEKNAFFVHRRIRWETLHCARMSGTKSMTPSALWISTKLLMSKQSKLHKHLESWEPNQNLATELRWYCTELCARLRNVDRVNTPLQDGFHCERPKMPNGSTWQHSTKANYDIVAHCTAHIEHLTAWRARNDRPNFLRWHELVDEFICVDEDDGSASAGNVDDIPTTTTFDCLLESMQEQYLQQFDLDFGPGTTANLQDHALTTESEVDDGGAEPCNVMRDGEVVEVETVVVQDSDNYNVNEVEVVEVETVVVEDSDDDDAETWSSNDGPPPSISELVSIVDVLSRTATCGGVGGLRGEVLEKALMALHARL